MTELVTIEHDRQAIYTFGTPYARKMLLPHVKRTERFEYLIGETKPNFPLPATIENVERACNFMFLSTCPYGPSPCLICIEKFILSIEMDYLDAD